MIDPPLRKKRGRPPTGLPRAKTQIDYAHVQRRATMRRHHRLANQGLLHPCHRCGYLSVHPTFCSTTCANLWTAQ